MDIVIDARHCWVGMARTLASNWQAVHATVRQTDHRHRSCPIHFPNGETALVMACDTDISIDDTVALRKEVEEIWGLFKKDVEGASLTNGVIRMVHPEGSGLITHSKGYGFVFVKRADGLWHCLQDDKK